ncbi:hypothetical protein [Synechococcus phage S-SRP01]|uniref:Uncharacterized protein n=1 Tax=Synechococcus phage S-SRP01 TaxID=2781607 RepID=A0A874M8A8_9CAUD|nr:hypothetical protein [Synechococcus phage S-SRP01]
MTNKQRTIVETVVFCGFACLISSITMLSAVGVDPFAPNAPQVQTVAKGAN